MKSQDTIIFVGLKISEKLQNLLDSSSASVKQFFAGNNPKHLQLIRIENDEYIGKATESSVSLEDLNNTLKNVQTMLRIICPTFSFKDDNIRILAITPAPPGANF